MCNTYYLLVAAVVSWTWLNVTLYVHCLSCVNCQQVYILQQPAVRVVNWASHWNGTSLVSRRHVCIHQTQIRLFYIPRLCLCSTHYPTVARRKEKTSACRYKITSNWASLSLFFLMRPLMTSVRHGLRCEDSSSTWLVSHFWKSCVVVGLFQLLKAAC